MKEFVHAIQISVDLYRYPIHHGCFKVQLINKAQIIQLVIHLSICRNCLQQQTRLSLDSRAN